MRSLESRLGFDVSPFAKRRRPIAVIVTAQPLTDMQVATGARYVYFDFQLKSLTKVLLDLPPFVHWRLHDVKHASLNQQVSHGTDHPDSAGRNMARENGVTIETFTNPTPQLRSGAGNTSRDLPTWNRG